MVADLKWGVSSVGRPAPVGRAFKPLPMIYYVYVIYNQSKNKIYNGTLAQLVEQWPFKPLVGGSNPSRPTFKTNPSDKLLCVHDLQQKS